MGSSSVQFRGKENVLQAYESRSIPAWSLYQGKQMIFKHEGTDIDEAAQALENCLDMLNGSTNAVYTIKVYEDAAKIKSNTPDDGSFNFRLNADEQQPAVGALSRSHNSNEIISRLQALEEKLTPDDDDDDDKTENNLLAGIMGNPMLQPFITQILSNLAGSLFNKPQPAAAAAVSSLAGLQDPNQDAKISAAVEILKSKTENLGELLLKLAGIAEKQPAQFQMMVTMLNSY